MIHRKWTQQEHPKPSNHNWRQLNKNHALKLNLRMYYQIYSLYPFFTPNISRWVIPPLVSFFFCSSVPKLHIPTLPRRWTQKPETLLMEKNPAPVHMVNIPLFTGFYTYQRWCRISSRYSRWSFSFDPSVSSLFEQNSSESRFQTSPHG